jgi:parallel beta-helix repeat protein
MPDVHESRRSCEECKGCKQITGDTTITEPGCYYVTKNITGAGTEVILIKADRVSIDLNGHTLTLPGTSGAVIRVEPGFTGISVRNGTLSGSRRAFTQDAHATKRSRVRLEHLTIQDYAHAGVHISGADQVDLLDNRIVSTMNHGVMINPGGGVEFTGHFLRNTLRCANSNFLLLSGIRGAVVRGNELYGEGDQVGIGVYGHANIVEGNTVSLCHGPGIDVNGTGNLIANNTVRDAYNTGIRVKSDFNRIVGNVVNKCQYSGIKIEGARNLIEGNHSSGNVSPGNGPPSYGLEFASGSDNAYRNNMLRGNASGAVLDPFGNTDAGGNIV